MEMKYLTNLLGVIEQSNINAQPPWKEYSTCGVFQSWLSPFIVTQKLSNVVEPTAGPQFRVCHEASGYYFHPAYTYVITPPHHHNTAERTHRVLRRSPGQTPAHLDKRVSSAGLAGDRVLSSLSMVLIEFTTFEERFGSAASRMTSMYSQFVRTACVTAGKPGYLIQFSVGS